MQLEVRHLFHARTITSPSKRSRSFSPSQRRRIMHQETLPRSASRAAGSGGPRRRHSRSDEISLALTACWPLSHPLGTHAPHPFSWAASRSGRRSCMKAFRSIRRGVRHVVASIAAGTFGNDFKDIKGLGLAVASIGLPRQL